MFHPELSERGTEAEVDAGQILQPSTDVFERIVGQFLTVLKAEESQTLDSSLTLLPSSSASSLHRLVLFHCLSTQPGDSRISYVPTTSKIQPLQPLQPSLDVNQGRIGYIGTSGQIELLQVHEGLSYLGHTVVRDLIQGSKNGEMRKREKNEKKKKKKEKKLYSETVTTYLLTHAEIKVC